MSYDQFEAGDRVKVIGQDIVGIVLRVHYDTNEVVIQDDYSEYEAPDDELVYRHDELQLLDSEGDRVMSYDYGDAIFNEATEEAGGYVVWVGHRGTLYEEEVRACEAYDDLTEGMTEEEVLRNEIGMEVIPVSELASILWNKAVSVQQ